MNTPSSFPDRGAFANRLLFGGHSPSPPRAVPPRFVFAALFLLLLGTGVELRMPSALQLFAVSPAIPVYVSVAAGLLYGPAMGAVLAFLGAYLLTSGIPLSPGSAYFSAVVVGYLSGHLRTRLFIENPLVPLIAGLLAGVLSEALFYVLTPRSPDLLLKGCLAQGVYGLVFTPVIFALLRRLKPASED